MKSTGRTLPAFGLVVFAVGCDAHRTPTGFDRLVDGRDAGAGAMEASTGGAGVNTGGTGGNSSGGIGATSSGGTTRSGGEASDSGAVGGGGAAGAGADAGNGRSDAGTGGTDAGAVTCAKGTWDDDGDPSTVCRPNVVQQIVTGERHTCALLSDGSVKCWGLNTEGQLGYPGVSKVAVPSSVEPVSITNLPGVTVTALAAGWMHTCALLSDGSVKCWGWNDRGQLGYGHTKDIGDDEAPSSVAPVSVTTLPGVTVKAIAAGRHTCALLSNDTVKCWGGEPLGYGNSEDIGDDELPSSVEPISVTTAPGVTVRSIAVGFYNTYALLSDGSLRGWGLSGWGELGYGNPSTVGDDEPPSSVGPVSVTSTPGVTVEQVTAGRNHTCALLSDGSVKCWGAIFQNAGVGYGNEEPIGDDELPSSLGPINLTTAPGIKAKQIVSGVAHTCALLTDDTVTCWGWSGQGELGYGNTDTIGDDELPSSVGPVSVTTTGSPKVVALSAGSAAYDTCAVLAGGAAKCWGLNADFELGYGTTENIGDDQLPSAAGTVVLF
jgi:alpha-tubulin suppressor-like RCC1 family protein